MFKTIIEGLEEYKKDLEEYAETCKMSVKNAVIAYCNLDGKKDEEAKEKYNQMTEQQRFKTSSFSLKVNQGPWEIKLKGMAQALGLTSEEQFKIKAEVKIKLGYPSSYFPFNAIERDRLKGRGIKKS